jgi:hypothetical protein
MRADNDNGVIEESSSTLNTNTNHEDDATAARNVPIGSTTTQWLL